MTNSNIGKTIIRGCWKFKRFYLDGSFDEEDMKKWIHEHLLPQFEVNFKTPMWWNGYKVIEIYWR